MTDIICKCGHDVDLHDHEAGCNVTDFASDEDCACMLSATDILRAHIAKLEAVVKAAVDWRNNNGEISDLIIAVDALDGTNGLS